MFFTQIVRCPDCGSLAQRHFQAGIHSYESSDSSTDISQVTARTECHDCDYFLEICMTTGQVIASHISPVFHDKRLSISSATEAPAFKDMAYII